MEAKASLPEVGQALDAPGLGLGASESGEQERCQNGNDGDDRQ
jgi:hypothetical protein